MNPRKDKETEKSFKGKGKDRKPFPRKEDKREKDPEKSPVPFLKKGKNNILWRTGDKTMTDLVARLPFGNPSGLPYRLNIKDSAGGTPIIVPHTVPGILCIRTRLTCGNSTVSTSFYNSAANLAFRKIYSFVRHANSGSKNYEAVDLGMYLVSIQQCLGLLGWMQRLVAVINDYSMTNRYMPKDIVQAMGVRYDDIIDNQPNLKYLIAWFGRAIGALAFPKLPIFEASYEAYKWIYLDSDSPKEQFYIIDSAGFGKYNPTLTANGGGITFTTANPWGDPIGATPALISFNGLSQYVHEIMDVLLSDEDIGIISGDILKAYGKESLFIPEAFGMYDPFVKDTEALAQIHNAHVVSEDRCVLTQYEQRPGGTHESPYLVPTYTGGTQYPNATNLGRSLFIDAFSRVPDSDEVVNACVLNPLFTMMYDGTTSKYYVNNVVHNLHLPVDIYVKYSNSGNFISLKTAYMRTQPGVENLTLTDDTLQVTNFDWHPVKLGVHINLGSYINIYAIGDLQNSRFFDFETGDRIHEACTLNLFAYSDSNFSQKL